jgi:hypothetical protein
MSIVALFVFICVIGVVCWLITTYVPMPEPFPKLIILAGVLIVILLLLQAFGLLGSLNAPVPHIR